MLKRILVVSPFIFLAYMLSFEVGVTSCTKTDTIVDTVTKIKVDTLIQVRVDTLKEKDTLLTPAILTANSWKILEDRALIGTTFLYYLRGGSSNTANFDNEYMTFNSNNTGIYHDNLGGETTFTWNFTDASNKKMVWLWNNPYVPGGPITITWENINYDDGAIRYTEYYTQSGTNILSAIVRIPK
jgi:hypothetical protein